MLKMSNKYFKKTLDKLLEMLLMTTMIYKWLLKHLWLIIIKKINFYHSWLGLPFLGCLDFNFCQSANSADWLIIYANTLETGYRVISYRLSIKYCIQCYHEMKYKVFPWEYTFYVNFAISQKMEFNYCAKNVKLSNTSFRE